MPSVKRIETKSSDGTVTLETGNDGAVLVMGATEEGSAAVLLVPEASLIEAVLEYAHERGLRRSRKAPKGNGAAKRTRTKPSATPPSDPAVMI